MLFPKHLKEIKSNLKATDLTMFHIEKKLLESIADSCLLKGNQKDRNECTIKFLDCGIGAFDIEYLEGLGYKIELNKSENGKKIESYTIKY